MHAHRTSPNGRLKREADHGRTQRGSAATEASFRMVSEQLRQGATTDGHEWTRMRECRFSRGRLPRIMMSAQRPTCLPPAQRRRRCDSSGANVNRAFLRWLGSMQRTHDRTKSCQKNESRRGAAESVSRSPVLLRFLGFLLLAFFEQEKTEATEGRLSRPPQPCTSLPSSKPPSLRASVVHPLGFESGPGGP